MDIKIKTTDYEITPAVRTYLEERLAAVDKMVAGDPTARCEVTLGRGAAHSKHGENWFVECSFIHPGSASVYAHAHAENINEAIDHARDELIRQVRRNKRFHIKMLRKGGAMIKKIMRRE